MHVQAEGATSQSVEKSRARQEGRAVCSHLLLMLNTPFELPYLFAFLSVLSTDNEAV